MFLAGNQTEDGWRPSGVSAGVNGNGAQAHRVLIVDDDPNLTRLLRTLLHSSGFEVSSAADGSIALDTANNESFDVIILDLRMPGLDGRTLYRELRARGVMAPVLIASAYGARNAQAELGAEGFIEKPFEPDLFVEAVERLIPSG